MKTRFLSCLTVASAVALAGCATDSPRTSPPQTDRPLRLAFITCARDARFFEPVKQGMNDAAGMLDVRCDWLGTPGVDVKAQAELVRQAVAQGYDGLAVNLIDPVAFDAVVEEAIQAGVAVVAFNVDDHATPNARLAAVNQRLYEAGRSLGQHVAPAIATGSHVLLTMHDEGVSALEDRRRGIQDALQTKGVRWTAVISGNDSAKGAGVIADALRQHPDVRVVLSTGQSDTEAAGLALEKHFPNQGYWSAGFDLSDATLRLIQAGHIRCTIDQQPYVQGFYPVVMLTQYLRYGLKPSSLDAGATVIDRSNAAQVLELTRRRCR
jgi:simple sugar transport system substrate-binding protein